MVKKKVFVSFDYENDRHFKNLLVAWDANSNFEFYYNDYSSGEIQTNDISRVKAALTAKINQATHTIVIIGKYANTKHKDHKEIGHKNWINFETAKSKLNRNKLVGIKLDNTHTSPDELLDSGAKWAMCFTKEEVDKALEEA